MKAKALYILGYSCSFVGLLSIEYYFFYAWLPFFALLNPLIVGLMWLSHKANFKPKQLPLEHNTAFIEQLLMQIDHEIINPISTLKVSVENLEEEGYSEAIAKTMTHSLNRLESVNQLYLRLLCLNTFDHLPMTRLDFSELLRNTLIDDLKPDLLASAQLIVNIPEEPIWISGHHQLLFDAFKSLFDYALFNTRNKHQLFISLTKHNSHLTITLEQHGNTPTLTKDLLAQQIFSMHHKDVPTTKPLGSAGLALTLVKRVVEHHKGLIDYQYCGQKTTRYHITLPLNAVS